MQNDMRDRLVELIQNAVDGCARHWAELIADHLIANGVIVPPKKVYDIILCKDGMKICEHEVKGIIYDCGYMAFDSRAIGNKIFLTREAAEQALKEWNKDE